MSVLTFTTEQDAIEFNDRCQAHLAATVDRYCAVRWSDITKTEGEEEWTVYVDGRVAAMMTPAQYAETFTE